MKTPPGNDGPMFAITIADRQSSIGIDAERLESAVALVCSDRGFIQGAISLAIVDDPTIRDLNRRFLNHDYATDCLSFVLECREGFLEGEIVVSSDTAIRRAPEYGLSAAEELLLYVIHAALHLTGYDDTTPAAAAEMRAREEHYLRQFQQAPRVGPVALVATCAAEAGPL